MPKAYRRNVHQKSAAGRNASNLYTKTGYKIWYKIWIHADQSRPPWTRLYFSLPHRRNIFRTFTYMYKCHVFDFPQIGNFLGGGGKEMLNYWPLYSESRPNLRPVASCQSRAVRRLPRAPRQDRRRRTHLPDSTTYSSKVPRNIYPRRVDANNKGSEF